MALIPNRDAALLRLGQGGRRANLLHRVDRFASSPEPLDVLSGMSIFVDMLLAKCYIYEERAFSRHEGSKRARHGQLEGKQDEPTSVGREVFLSKRGLEKPVYGLLGRNCDRMELIDVYFSRMA